MTAATGPGCAGWRGPVMAARLTKLAMTLSVAGFALLVALNNLVDYGSNAAFVRHVLSMDTTFPGNALLGRAMRGPLIWQIAYAAIIVGEAATGLLLLAAGLAMLRQLRGSARAFADAKTLVHYGALVGFQVWFTGFMVVGGEWFAMWQSHVWNGQEAAFRFYVAILGVLIYVAAPEPRCEPAA